MMQLSASLIMGLYYVGIRPLLKSTLAKKKWSVENIDLARLYSSFLVMLIKSVLSRFQTRSGWPCWLLFRTCSKRSITATGWEYFTEITFIIKWLLSNWSIFNLVWDSYLGPMLKKDKDRQVDVVSNHNNQVHKLYWDQVLAAVKCLSVYRQHV